MIKIKKSRWDDYKHYHLRMISIGDCDPAYPALNYLVSRFELNEEQRYWIAYLYSCCYCVPTVYYIYNEFPDYENVDVRRLAWWWKNNKNKLLFQTDRAKVKNFDLFVKMFESYMDHVGESQKKTFESFQGKTLQETYNNLYDFCGDFYYFGRYTLFLYLESIYTLTGLPMEPTGLDLKNAESCRNGLCYALGQDNWVKFHGDQGKNWKGLNDEKYNFLNENLSGLVNELKEENPKGGINYWNIETSLCAYKKLFWKSRYLGYYIDRLMVEIKIMEESVKEGVDWSVLWDFRKEFFNKKYLGEFGGWKGIRKKMFGYGLYEGTISLDRWSSKQDYTEENHKEIYFRGDKDAY